jgi:hypothetical protein
MVTTITGSNQPMTEESGKAKALQAIGAYMCAYSDAVYELGETLKVLFKTKEDAMGVAIVTAIGDFTRQAKLMGALCQDARNSDGTELSPERKEKIGKTISHLLDCNERHRVKLAHGRLQPRDDGSVEIVHLKVEKDGLRGKDPVIWSPKDWTDNTNKLTKLVDELRSFQQELKTLKIVPTASTLGWLTKWDDSGQITHRQSVAAVLLSSGPSEPPLGQG